MPVFTKNDFSILFIHIPKTGGTTVESAFLAAGWTMAHRLGGPLGRRPGNAPCSPQHMHGALLREVFAGRRFDRVFCISRHPLDRFASEFRFRAAAGHPLAKAGIDAFARAALWRFEKRNPFVLDNHIRPQSEFPWAECRIFRLEDGMGRILAEMSEGLPEPAPALPDEVKMRSDSALDAAMSPATVARLRKFYDADFRAFDYD